MRIVQSFLIWFGLSFTALLLEGDPVTQFGEDSAVFVVEFLLIWTGLPCVVFLLACDSVSDP